MIWQTARFNIDLTQPKIMGIVNVTPDSFSDGGRSAHLGSALRLAEQLVKDGADILDLGGESSRPGATQVPLHTELERIMPVLVEVLKWSVPISVDTYKPQIMQAVLDMGTDIINDIWALRQTAGQGHGSALDIVAKHGRCGVCLMHMHREPQTMQTKPMQGDVLLQVLSFLEQTIHNLISQGVDINRISIDPGIGFGKTTEQNFSLLARQAELLTLGVPLVAGWSRKTAIGAVTGLDMSERTSPSVVAAVLAVQQGASVVRVHDVRETAAAFKVLQAMQNQKTYNETKQSTKS